MAYKRIQSPLAINIFWHNANEKMYQLGDLLYDFFLRNVNNPLDRHMGIPVYIYPYIPNISDLQLKNTIHSANVFLVDDEMTGSEDWERFANSLNSKTQKLGKEYHQIFPVKISEHAFKFTDIFSKKNFIKVFDIDKSRQEHHLLIELSHAINRLLYKDDFATVGTKSNPPVKLFLSHAKNDGEILTKELRRYIHEHTGLESFFDANDIADGFSFAEELENHIMTSILVAIQSDEYSSREWCRREILLAKKHNCPVIVINQFKKGELRSFPYIGNVPHRRYSDDLSKGDMKLLFDLVILEALREALRIKFNELKLRGLSKNLNLKIDTNLIYPPELISLVNLKDTKEKIILYPDPPLGMEEISIIKEIRDDLKFLTPTLLPLISKENEDFNLLSNQKIAISLSETDQSDIEWIQNRSIQNLMVELCRYLLVGGARLIYSGDIFYKSKAGGFNFSKLLIKLLQSYRNTFQENNIHSVDNYRPYPFGDLLKKEDKLRLKNIVKFHIVKAPENLEIEKKHAQSIQELDTFDKKYVYAKSLTVMRNKMLSKATGLLVLGGKWMGFKSKMPGVLEEALIALKLNKPTFIIGAFGGVAETIAKALEGKETEHLKNTYYDAYDPNYAHFKQKFNKYSKTSKEERVDYESVSEYLINKGKSASDYGLNNGLSKKENQRLFRSKNESEIIHLVLKGLSKTTKA
jgi:hypothetical protein